MKHPHFEYFLCTDGDLKRLLFILSTRNDEYSRRETTKVKREIDRREKLDRSSLIREFRKKIK
tara:strand:+ start:205 stop:393 length:189 start_codon:yes stop_codon:yes gene_type:complete